MLFVVICVKITLFMLFSSVPNQQANRPDAGESAVWLGGNFTSGNIQDAIAD